MATCRGGNGGSVCLRNSDYRKEPTEREPWTRMNGTVLNPKELLLYASGVFVERVGSGGELEGGGM